MKFERRFLVPALAAALTAFSILPAIAQQSANPAEVPAVPNGPVAVMDTSMGRITCQLFNQQAPKAVAHFVALAEGKEDWTNSATGKKYHNRPLYNGTIFHRVIPGY
ncbi:MAG: peptidylprolyl isomerase, partial [Anaerolineaceae bacterium]|nr:peptidylprolyl isomerase [Anaerolineaceae bacterium]